MILGCIKVTIMVPLATSGTFNPVRPIFTSFAFGTSCLNSILIQSIEMTTRFLSVSYVVSLFEEDLFITGNAKQLNTMEASPCNLSSSHMYLKDVHACSIWCVLDALWLFHHFFDREIITIDAFHELLGTFCKLLWVFDNLSSSHHSTINDVLYAALILSIGLFP